MENYLFFVFIAKTINGMNQLNAGDCLVDFETQFLDVTVDGSIVDHPVVLVNLVNELHS